MSERRRDCLSGVLHVLDDPALACEGAAMCNHYRKDQKVIQWAVSRIPRARITVPMDPLPGHTYPLGDWETGR